MYQSREKVQNYILLAADTISLIISYFVAGYLWFIAYRGAEFSRTLKELIASVGTIVIAYILMIIFFDLNSKFAQRGPLDELKAVIKTNVLLTALISMIEFAQHNENSISRGVSYCTVIINTIFMYQIHYFIKMYMLQVYRNKKSADQIFLVTTADRVEKTLEDVAKGNEWTKRITGVILIDDDRVGQEVHGIPIVATFDNMIQYSTEQIVDEVFINVPYDTGNSLHDVIMQFENMGTKVHLNLEILNRFQDFYTTFDTLGTIPVITFANNYYDYRQLALKRIMDIAGAIVGLFITGIVTIFLAPVLLHESPGPLIFKQKRVGKNGRFFYMYKFRSMYADAEERKKELLDQNEMDGLMFKMENDPRVTKVGRFIRKTSIDELPQFWNVLKGDMSLVGTRPPTIDEFVQYKSYHKRRLSAKPGITGLWQVSGRNDIENFDDVVKLDLEYIDNWSLYLDVKILLKTVGAVFTHTGK